MESEKIEGSPKEDFNPLMGPLSPRLDSLPDFPQVDDSPRDPEHYSGQYDDESPSSSLGGFGVDYGSTPPISGRYMRRQKDKFKADKYSKQKLTLQDIPPANDRSVPKLKSPRGFTGTTFEELENPDSDEEVNEEKCSVNPFNKKKRHSSKTFKHTRSSERDLKLMAGDFVEGGTSSLPAVSGDSNTIKVGSLHKFQSISSKPLSQQPVEPIRMPGLLRRQTVERTIECPKNRVLFHKVFSAVINMGVNNRKERDKKMSSGSPYNRQLSSEQEMWQQHVNDAIWLELQAWHNGRTMQAQDHYLINMRNQIPEILNYVMNFRLPRQGEVCDRVVVTSPSGSRSHTPTICVTAESFTQRILYTSIHEQRCAIRHVIKLFNDLESMEILYPACKSLGQSFELYNNPGFRRKVDALQVWLNVTKDLSHKIKLMGRVLGVKAHDVWPIIDKDCPVNDGSVEMSTSTSESDFDGMEQDNQTDATAGGSDQLPKLHLQTPKQVHFTASSEDETPSPKINLNDPFNSRTPGSDSSTPIKGANRSASTNSFTMLSRTSSDVSLDDSGTTSIYRPYVDKALKKMGMKKLCKRLQVLLDKSLQKAKEALERPARAYEEPSEGLKRNSSYATSPTLHPDMDSYIKMSHRRSLDVAVDWYDEMLKMGLPSFQPSYLFLLRIPLDVIHECLKLRLEQQPDLDPSLLSLRQLIRECKDVLEAGVLVKHYYQEMVSAVLREGGEQQEVLDILEQFDDDMKRTLEMYFRYIHTWIRGIQKMEEASRTMKNALEDAWLFTIKICPHVRGGEAEAGKRFCLMASNLFDSIADYLETGMDECINQLYDSQTDTAELMEEVNRSMEVRHAVIQTCRGFKSLFHETRERASKALGFAKMLRKDLEIAADFNIIVSPGELLQKLKDTGHVQVLARHDIGSLMFVPQHIKTDLSQIHQLLDMTRGREDLTSSGVEQDGYLILVNLEGCTEKDVATWCGETLHIQPTAETSISLSHIEVEGLLLVVQHSSQLSILRKEFQAGMGKTVELVNMQTSCHQAIGESLAELRQYAINLREKVASAIKQVDEKLDINDLSEMDETEKYTIIKLIRETLHQCYNFGLEYHKELSRLVAGDSRHDLGPQLLDFARQWMVFATTKCERGRGLRPRWANHGLDFLLVICDPCFTAPLEEEEFLELKKTMDDCIKHCVGDRQFTPNPTYPSRLNSPDVTNTKAMFRNLSWPEPMPPKAQRSVSTRSMHSDPSTPFPLDSSNPLSNSLIEEDDGHRPDNLKERIKHSIAQFENHRDNKMFKAGLIGRVTEKKIEVDYHIKVRRVNFKWQRGNKIGEGQFGKVYTAVNMDTGELMAMKEIKFKPNDHQAIKEIADELKIFEGIRHESLVRHYGVEVYKDEMFVFMEYCDEGTIEEASRLVLDEPIIRQYTREILVAVNVLHDNSIIHRDIKGANIFLTSNGPLKLGDFGCSVQLKSQATITGEISSMAGTTAFMAPEVITRNTSQGHGRAADIWSLGCVVIEMATGKRPWHELENTYQIMFKVGMGSTPPIPDNLSEEGKDFLSHCFEHEPKQRWKAADLLNHQFVKVVVDEDSD
ncbi:unnamed protein product [Owenia fusiformis]|uniref:Mitogen-activated protein kinase kinase kinase 4 n=1 Tax=Owenia fusiformis TaxID=6347 RepID=A0A8J1XIF9_OWEFU|nr:unnamed protein product [Owenia fusiformis]